MIGSATPPVTAVVVSPPAARTPAIVAPSAPPTSFDRMPDAASTLSSAPSVTEPLSAVAVGTSSMIDTVIEPVAVLPAASLTV